MKIYPIKASYPKLELISDFDAFIDLAKDKYPDYLSSGFYQEDSKSSFIVHRIQTEGKTHLGIIGNADIKDFQDKTILAHENTLASKEQKMMDLLLQRQAMIKPVLISYDRDSKLDLFLERITSTRKPFLVLPLSDDTEIHSFWKISSNKKIKRIKKSLSLIAKGYIADGHHRCSTLVKLFQNDSIHTGQSKSTGVLCAYFSFSQLKIYDFNRIINLGNRMTSAEFVIKLSKYANFKPILKAEKARKKYELSFYLERSWYRLKWKNKIIDKHERCGVILDSAIFNSIIMGQILNIKDISSDDTSLYVEGTKSLDVFQSYADQKDGSIGFCLFPVKKSELKKLAKNRIALPPKSTAFVPRIKNGMIVQKL